MSKQPTFAEECINCRDEGWSIREIADYTERSEADVRKALGIEEQKPTAGDGILPYLGI